MEMEESDLVDRTELISPRSHILMDVPAFEGRNDSKRSILGPWQKPQSPRPPPDGQIKPARCTGTIIS